MGVRRRYDAFSQVPERQRSKWCFENYLNFRSMSSAVSVRRQLEGLLRRMTRSRWAGFFMGLAVTAAVQSTAAGALTCGSQ